MKLLHCLISYACMMCGAGAGFIYRATENPAIVFLLLFFGTIFHLMYAGIIAANEDRINNQ